MDGGAGCWLSCLVFISGCVGKPLGSVFAGVAVGSWPGRTSCHPCGVAQAPTDGVLGLVLVGGVQRCSLALCCRRRLGRWRRPRRQPILVTNPPFVHGEFFVGENLFERDLSSSGLFCQSSPAREDVRCVSGQELEITPLNPSGRKRCCRLVIRK